MLLPKKISVNNEYPSLSRPLRLGIVGGGRIAKTQALAASMSGRWSVVAGALSSDEKNRKSGAEISTLMPIGVMAIFS